jgi:hypothetical protein
MTYARVVILLCLYSLEQCLNPVLWTSIKTCNFVTFYEFSIHLGLHHTTHDDVIFDLVIVKHSTFCWLMRLFLSNSGSLMSRIMTTSCVLIWPARVLTSLVSPSNFVIMPFGKADLLIIETFKPESKSTQKSLQLLIVPIVSAVQMSWVIPV